MEDSFYISMYSTDFKYKGFYENCFRDLFYIGFFIISVLSRTFRII